MLQGLGVRKGEDHGLEPNVLVNLPGRGGVGTEYQSQLCSKRGWLCCLSATGQDLDMGINDIIHVLVVSCQA